ncbi:hypothetical protein BB934_25735 [Microvirga ossetica]|uniref:Uncharacterized protein n=1 Tax=Microvirga ossetica TaxID=1882682 RepID=A0A1B2EMJ0_9HYPH|nr:hypothetical protein [Microvirga ossetica]ANY81198.1 hypothetical protein BB934_25735 [Microvirga ossetica]
MLVLWMKLATDTTMLAVEARSVIWARMSQVAIGQGTPDETLLMVTEKVNAFAEAAAMIAAGGSAQQVVSGYRQKVQANVERLR